jgi:eukaryotic-like serine/threonine-protein kinase
MYLFSKTTCIGGEEVSNELVLQEDNVLKLIEEFKTALTNYSTGESTDLTDEDYKRIRKIIIGIPKLKDITPDFIFKYRSFIEFWGFIKEKHSTYAERRTYLAEVFNPMIDRLEEESIDFHSNYLKENIIGSGGFGQVFKYKNKLIDMEFAVKVLSPIFSNGDEGNLERFFREARILFKLNHPNIIKVHDIGMIGTKPYIRMEYFEGKDLNNVLKDYGVLEKDKALVLIEEIGGALNHAHNEVKVVHRDLRPSNIMVAKPNKFRIIDFGLGVFLENELVSRITRTGQNIVGGHYTAPELLEDPTRIDPRSDIYSLGAVWFTVLTGRPPAGSRIKEQLMNIDGMSTEYTDLILKCLDDVHNRYQNINELLEAIKAFRKDILT